MNQTHCVRVDSLASCSVTRQKSAPCMFNSCTRRAHACIMRQLVLWDMHTKKDGSFQFGGQCIVLYEICHLIKLNLHLPYFDEGYCFHYAEMK